MEDKTVTELMKFFDSIALLAASASRELNQGRNPFSFDEDWIGDVVDSITGDLEHIMNITDELP